MKKIYSILGLFIVCGVSTNITACATEGLLAFGKTVGRFYNRNNLTTILEKSGKNFSIEELFSIHAAFMAVTYGKYTPSYGFAHHDHTRLLTDNDLSMTYENFMKIFPTTIVPQIVPILPSRHDIDMYRVLKNSHKSEDHPKMEQSIWCILRAYAELAENQNVYSNDSLLQLNNRINFINALAQLSPVQLLKNTELNTHDAEKLSIIRNDPDMKTSIVKKIAKTLNPPLTIVEYRYN